MTCIAAIKTKDSIWIGGDSTISDDNSKSGMKQSKVFLSGTDIIGCAGDLRFISLMSNWLYPERLPSTTISKYIHIDLVNSIREHLSEGGYVIKDNEQEKIGSNMIFTYEKELYLMDENFGIWSPDSNYGAIGSGADVAMGVLFALAKLKTSEEEKITTCLDAASKYAIGVGPPYKILSKTF